MAVEKLEGGGCLASVSGVSSPRTACLWKQLLNAGTCLNPGLTAKLDVNYCVDIMFSLTVAVELLPVLFPCRRTAQDASAKAGLGVINPDRLFSHTVGHICGDKIQSNSFDTTHFIGTTENYWLLSTGKKEFWIYSNETKRKVRICLSLAINWEEYKVRI